MKVISYLKSVSIFALMIGFGQGAIANTQIQDAQNWAYHNCGSPNIAHCQGSGDTGDVSFFRYKPTYFWIAIWSNHPQATNMPMFYSIKETVATKEWADTLLKYLELYGMEQCERTYGQGYCKIAGNAYGGKESYVAVASTVKKDTVGNDASHISWTHYGKASTEQQALQGCQATAQRLSQNPADCRIIFSQRFTQIGNRVNADNLHKMYRGKVTF